MKTCKGIVKNNAVVLEEGAQLPEGAEVEVRLIEHSETRQEVFARVLANRIHHYVGIDELIEQDKEEREERVDQWLPQLHEWP
jgi:hypothetical protein